MNTTEVELMPDTPAPVQQELQVIVQQNALQPETAKSLQASFAPLFQQARDVIDKSRGIVVTDAKQKLEMKMAKACRLELKALRVTGEKTRKELKEESLRKGKAIDGFNAILVHLISTEENRLQAQEDFVERQEEQRRATLKADREKVLLAIQVDPNLYQLADMTEETFQQLVEGTKLARAAEAERRRKEEAERIEREAKEAAERERIRLENERLKKEAEEKEAALKAEREAAAKAKAEADERTRQAMEAAKREQERIEAENQKKLAEFKRKAKEEADAAEAKAKAEREEHDRKVRELEIAARKQKAADIAAMAGLEKKMQALREADERRIAAEKEAARKAAAAPDRDKLINYAHIIKSIELPTLSTPEALSIANVIETSRDKFVDWVLEKAGGL